jgi:hypothetical protein
MKRLLEIILLTIIIAPCILIVNESDNFLPNIIGMVYICLLILFGKTRTGYKFFQKFI